MISRFDNLIINGNCDKKVGNHRNSFNPLLTIILYSVNHRIDDRLNLSRMAMLQSLYQYCFDLCSEMVTHTVANIHRINI